MTHGPARRRVRKQVDDLQPEDFDACAIWEFALDELRLPGQDERTVRPRPDWGVADPAAGPSVARADFRAADGTRYAGFYHVTAGDLPISRQPTILTSSGAVNFWLGTKRPAAGLLERYLAWLGTTAEGLFPLLWRGTVPAVGHDPRGAVTAFRRWSPSDPEGVPVPVPRMGWRLRR